MGFAALIIAQSELYKVLSGYASTEFVDEIGDGVGHEFKLAQMENGNDHMPVLQFTAGIAYLLRETFEGSPEGQPSAYLDRGTGFFSTLGGLSAADVSKEFQGTTIAAQTE